jgi:hypothetical protein
MNDVKYELARAIAEDVCNVSIAFFFLVLIFSHHDIFYLKVFPEYLPSNWQLNDVIRLKIVLDCNSHHFGCDAEHVGLFPAVAIALNHDCYPNTDVRIFAYKFFK